MLAIKNVLFIYKRINTILGIIFFLFFGRKNYVFLVMALGQVLLTIKKGMKVLLFEANFFKKVFEKMKFLLVYGRHV